MRNATHYVLKVVKTDHWTLFSSSHDARGEAHLWSSGALRALPAPLTCPMIDVVYNEEFGEHWLLMDDVSSGIRPRGAFVESNTRTLFGALARLHARYWDRSEELSSLPLASLEDSTAMIADAVILIARGGNPKEPRIAKVLESFFVLRHFLPIFLETLGPKDADFYLALCEDRRPWLEPLEGFPATFLHGDLRRANISISSDHVTLFDWEMATRGPAVCDLQWHFFVQYWAYPPADGRSVHDRKPLLEDYLRHLEGELGSQLDRAEFVRAWELAFLRVLVQLGFLLIDPLTGPHTPDDIDHVRRICREAIDLARRTLDEHAR